MIGGGGLGELLGDWLLERVGALLLVVVSANGDGVGERAGKIGEANEVTSHFSGCLKVTLIHGFPSESGQFLVEIL